MKGLPGVLLATLSTQAVASWAMLALASIAPIVAESFGLPPALIGYQIAIIYGVAMLVSLIAGGFVMRWGACRVSQLAVNGRDLMAAGIPAGPALRRVLEALLDGVIRAEYPNEKPALLAAAQKMIAS